MISNFVLGVIYQCLLLLFTFSKFRPSSYFKLAITFSFSLFIISCFLSLWKGYFLEYWDLRDHFRLFISLTFFFFILNSYKFLNFDKALFLTFLVYLFVNSAILSLWFVDRSLVSFLDNYNFVFLDTASYWRYSGFLGNPNYNGAMSVLILFFLLFANLDKYNPLLKTTLVLFCFLNIAASYSRTAIVCCAVLMLFYCIQLIFSKGGNKKAYILMLPLIFYLLYLFLLGNDFKFNRYDNISYTSDARFKFVMIYFEYFNNNIENFLFGTVGFSDVGLSITDNGHLLIVYKYGLFFYLMTILSLLIASYRNRVKIFFLFITMLLMFTMPILTNPKIFIFFTFIYFSLSRRMSEK